MIFELLQDLWERLSGESGDGIRFLPGSGGSGGAPRFFGSEGNEGRGGDQGSGGRRSAPPPRPAPAPRESRRETTTHRAGL